MENDVILQTTLSASQALELDELLWTALWKPLGLIPVAPAVDIRKIRL